VYNDSGADVSCISTKTATRLRLEVEPSGTVVCNPNGIPFKVQGSAFVPLKFGDRDFGFRFHVLDDLDVDILVGDDFLRKFDCVLSYGPGCVEYDGILIKTVSAAVKTKRETKAYRSTNGAPVIITKDVTLTKGQLRDVNADIELPEGFVYGIYSWTFEPLRMTEQAFGIRIVPAVVKLEGRSCVTVRLGCPGRSDIITIPAGTVVGTVHVIRSEDEPHLRKEIRVLKLKEAELTSQSVEQPVMDQQGSVWEAEKGDEFRRELSKTIAQLPSELTSDEKKTLEETLSEFRETLLPLRLGCTHVTTVDIDPGTARPVCHRDRRWSPQEAQAIKDQVASLLAAGLIEPSDSPWSNRLVCAPKKGPDGTKSEIRVCVDFRDVNLELGLAL
jgi:hypothetical protein